MNFSDQLKTYQWDEIKDSIYHKNSNDVKRALSKDRLDLEDFKALISPEA